ncbi:hypothetical protein MLD38_019085 [Melastoma candidum]|uniref:Uncharacterized protein n=1 Tax=Melastoma candidum TaxID=119954 RepID=A0ACB9QWG5_9MYRT|nr:hypothetical protein MLD38_019085 [Melastoma candidum]
MNQYHIYEAIGRGKHSTVYKGRKKKTIEYFAIKSVDKSQKAKVLQEVRILHSLDHPNVLKFYSWYETSAHLWLVLEYCVGGDLISLLRQDGHLPEESVHDLATDLVRALQYIHSKGIIYCDLKPSNILMDENGGAKLCDFGLARKWSDIARAPSSSVPQGKRGTPCYMAPELFEDGGVHSYASDFWALGCVLYECYAGRPPFTGGEFTQLVKSILMDPTPPLPGNPSRPFVNLIESLLVKNPGERITWPELCGHAFWKSEFPLAALPPQPAFDSTIDRNCKPCLTECNGVKPTSPLKHQEKDARSGPRRDENTTKVPEAPAKSAASARKTNSKASEKGLEEKRKGSAYSARAVNLLRLSRIAKSNLQRENEKENYRRCLPNGSEVDSEVRIENADMELNFDENTEDDSQEEQDGCDVPTSAPVAKTSGNNDGDGKSEDMDIDMHIENSPISEVSSTDELRRGVSPANSVPGTPSNRPLNEEKNKGGTGHAQESDSSKSQGDTLLQVIWHLSDSSVRPVMPNRKADKTSEQIPSLPFAAVQPSDLSRISKEQMESLVSRTLAILSGNNSLGEKQNVIKYLEMLSSHPDAANMLINGPIMLVLIKMLRQSKVTVLRVQVAAFIGLLIRHCTLIVDDLSNSGLLGALTDGVGDRQEKIRRFSMAALGELLYYISTQSEQNGVGESPQSPSKDGKPTVVWQIPNSVIQLVCSLLRKGEDDMTQLYALRTLENVCSQGGNWSARFTSQDVISNLCYIYRAPGKPESMRLTAGSCLVRLVRFSPASIQQVMSKISFKDFASSLVKGSPREQQICVNLLIMSTLKSHATTNTGRQLLSSTEEKTLASCLVSLIEQGSEVLRGKALVLVALICKSSKKWLLHFFCSSKLISVFERLSKEKDNFVQRCLNDSMHIMASNIPSMLNTIVGDIQLLISGRRQGHMSPLNSRAVQKTNIHLFPAILNLLRSPSLKQKMSINQLLQQLAKMIKILENSFQGRDDCQSSVLRIVDSITVDCSAILLSREIFIHEILPSLAALYKGNKDGDARFLCLKILFDVMVVILNEPSSLKQSLDELKSISSLLFLPLYPAFIKDEDPIPMYAQKLLLMLIDFNLISIPDILQPTTVTQCFKFLHGDLSLANVNDVKLCVAVTSAPQLDMKLLSQLKVVRRVGSLLEFVYVKGMEDFMEPTLGLCRALLQRSVCYDKDFARPNMPALLDDRSSNATGSIKDITDFSVSASVFLDMSGSPDANISDMASECVVLLLKAAPREGAAGLFGNLSKVSAVLGGWKRGGGASLPVQRMVHALGYSCRQYMLHGMILSVSMMEVSRIEGILSDMKNCGEVGALAQAAAQVCSELRRFPRNV